MAVFSALLSLVSNSLLVASPPTGTTWFYINNLTGVSNDAVYVTFQAPTVTGTLGGNTSSMLSADVSYTLTQFLGLLDGAGGSAPTGSVPVFTLDSFSGGRIYFTVGTPLGNSPPTSSMVHGLFEGTITGNSTSNNVDTSYVDSISLPLSFFIKDRATGNGTVYSTGNGSVIWPNSVTTTPGNTIFNYLKQPGVTPAAAQIAAGGYDVIATVGNSTTTIGQMHGTATILAPQIVAEDYPGWSNLWTHLKDRNIALKVGSYTSPISGPIPLQGALFGFSEVTPATPPNLPQSPFNANIINPGLGTNDPSNLFLAAQSYDFTVRYLDDITSGISSNATAAIAAFGINGTTSGLQFIGSGYSSGNATGNFSIFIPLSDLTNTAVYGSNAQYVIYWDSIDMAVQTTNTNSLADRVVGDLFAGLNLGWAASGNFTAGNFTVAEHRTATSTGAAFVDTPFGVGGSLENKKINELSSGEYFYLISLAAWYDSTQGQDFITYAKWFGEEINPDNPDYYNTYGGFQQLTGAYTLAFSDRIQGPSPDLYYLRDGADININDIYIEIQLLPGDYNVIPEPSTASLLLLLGMGAWAWRRKFARHR